MEIASREYIINTVFRTNILPVISECNTSCIFCSHRQNPEAIEVFRMPKLGLKDFDEILNFVSPNKKLVIGESATRIVEGEPLLHKDFIEIIKLVRSRFSYMPIQITTNGILLDETMIDLMAQMGGIEINLSINCIHPEKRRQILGLKKDHDITSTVELLRGRISFSGSCVLVPGMLEWEDVQDIVALLDRNGAQTVRLFLPGYTKLAETSADLFEIYENAYKFAMKMRAHYAIPVIVEPSFFSDLCCRVEGVIKGTPSSEAGIVPGDIITHINKTEINTRVEGFNAAFSLPNPLLTVRREDSVLEIRLRKARNTPPGFVVLYDMDTGVVQQVAALVERHKAGRVLLVTSELAQVTVAGVFNNSVLPFEYDIVCAANRFFGGTIKCAGLLTAGDIVHAVEEYLEHGCKPDLIVIPPVMFDFKRRDLLGVSIKEIESRLGIAVDTI